MIHSRRLRSLPAWFVSAVLLGSDPALATKPCPESVCYRNTTFDAAACARAASWIAVGRIVRVIDHPTGDPTFKNFAEFTFHIDRWERGKPPQAPTQIRFRVGWCKNGRILPEDPQGRRATMRFYGAGSPNAPEPEYLWFEPIGG